MRIGFVLATLTIIAATPAHAGRGLPAGEESPAVIQKIFTGPEGELQFTHERRGYSAFLRTSAGGLYGFREIRGGEACAAYFVSDKDGADMPAGCEILLQDDTDGRTVTVRTDDLQETGLVGAALSGRRTVRYVAL